MESRMAFVIAVAQRKGGAGKSTIAANVAAAYAEAGQRVALLDLDPQRSLARWDALRGRAARARPLHFEAPSAWRVPGILDRLRREHDVVLLDTAPHDDTDARIAIRGADLVLVPLQPSPADVWSMEATLDLARKEGRPIRLVLNRAPAAGRLLASVKAEIAARGLPLAEPAIGNRSAFAQAFMAGLGAVEAAPKSVAAGEIRALAAALRGA
jgi:chromosome partitioning protein